MDHQDPTFQKIPSVSPGAGPEEPEASEGQPIKIHLAEIPAPRLPAPRPIEPAAFERFVVPVPEPEESTQTPSRLAPVKAWVRKGFFNPAKAFEDGVDWGHFRRAQVFLFLLSVSLPFLMLLLFGLLLGIVYAIGASLYSVSSPNPIPELMIYPFIFVLTRGYWIAYLALPIGMFITGWIWAAASAWALSRGEMDHFNFGKALAVSAMFGAMLAPFTMFPFLRFLAVAVILWIFAKNMEDRFHIGFWRLIGRGGLILLSAGFLYAAFERKVESVFPAGEELRNNLDGFLRQQKRLEWPSFRTKIQLNPNEILYSDLSDLNPQIRERAVKKGLGILNLGTETPEFRFRIAKRMADNGQTEAFLFVARYAASGQGTEADPAAAVEWIQKFTEANPSNLEAGLEKARILIQANRRLDGKISLVQLAKAQMKDLNRITTFIQKENLGQIDTSYTWEVQSLYQQGNSSNYVGGYSTYSPSTGTKYVSEYQSKQALLLKKLYTNERENGLWFYRALVVEYARRESASPEIYGEVSTDYGDAELEQKIKEENPVALDVAADRCLLKGDIAKARQYWVAATRALNDDNRRSNVPLYLKLARSYDPEDATKDPDPKEATKYYLATLLISQWSGRMDSIGLGPLQRLQPGKIPDPMGQAFLDLCLKYDIPEAWVMMGDRYLNGDFPGVSKNTSKAKDCFLKAQTLGYKGPQFNQQLALASSTGRASLAGTK